MAVHFHFEAVQIPLNKRKLLKSFISQLFDNEGIILKNIDYIFCTDAYLLKLNTAYLKHDTYTDILTFDLSENDNEVTAEVYISVERVRENASVFSVPLEEELHRVIFHGALHLCGYGDHSEAEKKQMRAKENDYLKRYYE